MRQGNYPSQHHKEFLWPGERSTGTLHKHSLDSGLSVARNCVLLFLRTLAKSMCLVTMEPCPRVFPGCLIFVISSFRALLKMELAFTLYTCNKHRMKCVVYNCRKCDKFCNKRNKTNLQEPTFKMLYRESLLQKSCWQNYISTHGNCALHYGRYYIHAVMYAVYLSYICIHQSTQAFFISA